MKSNQSNTTKLSLSKQSIVKLNNDQKTAIVGGNAAGTPPVNCNKITATVIIVIG